MRSWIAVLVALAACDHAGHPAASDGASDSASDGAPDSPASQADAPAALVDLDGDGLDDATELRLAVDYMPFLSLAPDDGCSLDGMLVRVSPHPADPTKVLIVYDHLLEHDCGLSGHIGDDEVFGIAIDPARPAPAGILAIRAVSHQNTPCERDTECSTCGGGDARPACDLAADGASMWPVVYASKDKHGNYASLGQCPLLGTCFDDCTLATQRTRPPVVNAGEPAHHLIDDLTTQGFITAANGWTEPALMHFDPWNPTANFGGAGNIAADLADPAFVAAPCGP
jgi:hypothetical protein